MKAPLYARPGIGEVWLVDLVGEAVEVYRSPGLEGYRQTQTIRRDGQLVPEVLPDLEMTAGDILGHDISKSESC